MNGMDIPLTLPTKKEVSSTSDRAQMLLLFRNLPNELKLLTLNFLIKKTFNHDYTYSTKLNSVGNVEIMSLDAKNKRFLTGLSDGTVQLHFFDPEKSSKNLMEHSDGVWALALSQNGAFGISGSCDTTALVWNVQEGTLLAKLAGHTNNINSVAMSSDGNRALTGSDDKTVRLWNLQRGIEQTSSPLCSIKEKKRITLVSIAPQGTTAVFATEKGDTFLCDISSQKIKKIGTLKGPQGSLRAAVFNAEGTLLCAGGKECSIFLWNITKEQSENSPFKVLSNGTDPLMSLAYSDSQSLLASGNAEDGRITIWDIPSGIPLFSILIHSIMVHSLAFSEDGKTLYSGNAQGSIVATTIDPTQAVLLVQTKKEEVWNLFKDYYKAFELYSTKDSSETAKTIPQKTVKRYFKKKKKDSSKK